MRFRFVRLEKAIYVYIFFKKIDFCKFLCLVTDQVYFK